MEQNRDYDQAQIQQWENEGGALRVDRIEVLHVPPMLLDIQRRLAAIEAVLGLWPYCVNADVPLA